MLSFEMKNGRRYVTRRDSVASRHYFVKAISGFKTGNEWPESATSYLKELLAERERFELSMPFQACPLSRRIVSTAHAPLRAQSVHARRAAQRSKAPQNPRNWQRSYVRRA